MKLPIIAIFIEAYGYVWRERNRFLSLAFPGIVITALVDTGISSLPWNEPLILENNTDPGRKLFDQLFGKGPLWLYAVGFVAYSVNVAVTIIFSVAWHRTFLLPKERLSVRDSYLYHNRQLHFFLNYLRLGLVILTVSVVMTLIILTPMILFMTGTRLLDGIPMDLAPYFFAMLFVVVIIYVYARASMAFPATSVDNPMTLSQAWKFSAGHGWRLCWIIIFVSAPVFLVIWPLGDGPGHYLAEINLQDSLVANLLLGLPFQFVLFLGSALGITALSIIYRWLLSFGATPDTKT